MHVINMGKEVNNQKLTRKNYSETWEELFMKLTSMQNTIF